ncbi:hypothetical protein N9W44_00345 [Alphaproteobacteria bacterium]|jgi:hypothetical protein|nr:hypothetical protein [Alphaproteobacteria bacterium]
MAEDVVDIRKRIEEIRNEVSGAMASNRVASIDARPAGELAEFSVPGVTTPINMGGAANSQQQAINASPELLLDTRAGLEEALKLPSFQLNVRNQNSNRFLVWILIAQLLTNITLIGILWTKLG